MRRAAVLVLLGVLLGVAAATGAVLALASSSQSCAKLTWKGRPPAWLTRANPTLSSCR